MKQEALLYLRPAHLSKDNSGSRESIDPLNAKQKQLKREIPGTTQYTFSLDDLPILEGP